VDEARLFDTPKFWYDPKMDLAKTYGAYFDMRTGLVIYRGTA